MVYQVTLATRWRGIHGHFIRLRLLFFAVTELCGYNYVSTSMNIRQNIMKLVYPLIMKLQQKQVLKNMLTNDKHIPALVSFYDLQATAISGEPFSFSQLKGRKVLVVNVASNCGYTGQYAELEKLYRENKEKLVILGFPANDFKEQEPGNDESIASFCKLNYGVTFPLFQKHSVLKPQQNKIYQWLTDPALNGWNEQQPTWNFCKYLIDGQGTLLGFYAAPVSPLSSEIVSQL